MVERKTQTSEALVTLLKTKKTPLSVEQIRDHLKRENVLPNKTTIYRILDKLKKKNLVRVIQLNNGCAYYEWSSNHHHHHFFCLACKELFCLTQKMVDIEELKRSLPSQSSKMQHHDFNIYGTCGICQKSYGSESNEGC